jgi:parallel beta-helix repeat protein
VNAAREITDGSSPLPANPSNSTCFTTNATHCNYGAAGLLGNGNVQPTTAVLNDITVGADSQLMRVTARGSTTSFLGGVRARMDECTVVPSGPVGLFDVAGGWGPGTPAAGFSVADYSIVAKSYALNLIGSGTGISLSGIGAGAIANKLRFSSVASGGTGVNSTGANAHIVSTIIDSVSGAGKGINSTGVTAIITDNQIINTAGTSTGIIVSGNNSLVKTSQIGLAGSAQTGVNLSGNAQQVGATTVVGVAGGGTGIASTATNFQIDATNITNMQGNSTGIAINGATGTVSNSVITTAGSASPIGINLGTGSGFLTVANNQMSFPTTLQTPTAHATCILLSTSTQNRILGNLCSGGWRGIVVTGGSGQLTNTQITTNRLVGLAGACFALGGAGVYTDGNYCNPSTATQTVTVCDGGCTNRGVQCNSDADCTTCTNSVNKCIPEPVFAFVGSADGPSGGTATTHNTYAKNIVFASRNGSKQCTGGTSPVGQLCTVAAANGTCNGGVACAGTPAVCAAGGTETGQLCCQTAAGAACGVRTATPYMRVMDYGVVPTVHSLLNIALNSFFAGPNNPDSLIGIDFTGITAGGFDLSVLNSQIVSNIFEGADIGTATNSVGIRFPTNFVSLAHVDVADNLFAAWPTPASVGSIANYQGGFGSISLRNGHIAVGTGTGLPVITTAHDFFTMTGLNAVNTTELTMQEAMTGAGTVWKMTCNTSAVPGTGSNIVVTLRKNAVNTTLTCTITAAVNTCTTAVGAPSAPIAFAASDLLDWDAVSTKGTTLNGGNISCASYVSHDTAM